MNHKVRTYTEMMKLPTFEARFKYCDMSGNVGEETFGGSRWVNQVLYSSPEWKAFRRKIVLRDQGCEFGLPGYEIQKYGTVHHLNPVTKDDIVNRRDCVFDPENAVLVSSDTHRFLHYGFGRVPVKEPVVRRENDTCPWKG